MSTKETKTTKPKDENITLTKDEFLDIKKEMELLKKSVSRYRYEQAQAEQNKDNPKFLKCHFKKIQDKLIIGWVGKNEPNYQGKQEYIYANGGSANAPVAETMIAHLICLKEDNGEWETEDILADWATFYRSTEIETADIIKREGEMVTVRFDNPNLPQGYIIHQKFLNA